MILKILINTYIYILKLKQKKMGRQETPNPENPNKKTKEFFDLSKDYYLKITINENNFHFQCYNTELLDNIEYSVKISFNKLQELSPKLKQYKNIEDLFEYLEMIIDHKKCEIKKEGENLMLILIIEGNKKEINICLKKKGKPNDEFLQILSKEVIEIRKKNKRLEKIKKEHAEIYKKIDELKKYIFN